MLFQRTTVVVSDAVLFIGAVLYCNSWPVRKSGLDVANSSAKTFIASALVLFNPGLLLVDHIHFQYNGFLLGLLLISVAFVRKGYDLCAAASFASLLLFKHIFFYCAPLYFVYLLRHYCYEPDMTAVVPTSAPGSPQSPQHRKLFPSSPSSSPPLSPRSSSASTDNNSPTQEEEERLVTIRTFSVVKFIKLALVVVVVVVLGFGPFMVFRGEGRSPVDVFAQILSRLFPFGRGLVHAYWAPNMYVHHQEKD